MKLFPEIPPYFVPSFVVIEPLVQICLQNKRSGIHTSFYLLDSMLLVIKIADPHCTTVSTTVSHYPARFRNYHATIKTFDLREKEKL